MSGIYVMTRDEQPPTRSTFFTNSHPWAGAIKTFEGVEVVAVLEDTRVLLKHRRPDLYYYEMRHGESDWSQPMSVELGVLVNFWGTLILAKPLPEPLTSTPDSFIELTEEEANGLMWRAQELQDFQPFSREVPQ